MNDRPKIFCISMQRSGTTSIGDWLEAHGLRRAGFPCSKKCDWTRLWLDGNFEQIFQSTEFLEADVFEDDPWWCPEFYKFLAYRFPTAQFILLERDANSWFLSLCAHSRGQNPGWTDIHAKIYRREDDLQRLISESPCLDPTAWNLLPLFSHAEDYKRAYRRHNREAQAFFKGWPDRFFSGRLEDPQVFDDTLSFLGVPRNREAIIPHANKSSPDLLKGIRSELALVTDRPEAIP
jgi:hypothetical protein